MDSSKGTNLERFGGRLYRHEASTQVVTAARSVRKVERDVSQGYWMTPWWVAWRGGFCEGGHCGVSARVRWIGQQREA